MTNNGHLSHAYAVAALIFAAIGVPLSATAQIHPRPSVARPAGLKDHAFLQVAAAPRQQTMEIPRPTKPELEVLDARHVLEAQRYHENRKANYQQKRAEMLEGEKELAKAGEQVDALLNEMRVKYKCLLCDLTWEMVWMARQGAQFAPEKPANGARK